MMIEPLIILLPIISAGIGVYQKLFKTEESAIEFIDYVNKRGVKASMLRSSFTFLALISFMVSPLYIPLGWIWAILGGILFLSLIAVVFFSDAEVSLPDLGSVGFDKFVLKRKKQAILGSLLALLWVSSWI